MVDIDIFQFGDSQKLRLVRILRSTVMVRVGGGWVALDEFLVKNDPCRGKLAALNVLIVTVLFETSFWQYSGDNMFCPLTLRQLATLNLRSLINSPHVIIVCFFFNGFPNGVY